MSATDEREIRAVIEQWAAAVRRKDLDAILSRHSDDLVMFDVPPPLQSVGLEAYRRTWGLFFSWAIDPVLYAIDELSITAGADVAFAVALMRCSGRDASGTQEDLRFRLTIGLKKANGAWTIVHEHHSIPAV